MLGLLKKKKNSFHYRILNKNESPNEKNGGF